MTCHMLPTKFRPSIFILMGLVLLITGTLFAGNTGQVSGVITDDNSGEPLPGVNVMLEGTSKGAISDINGAYVIIGVAPGTYTLKARYLGYHEITRTNVAVDIDRTTRVNLRLQSTAIDLDEQMVVTANRDAIALDISSSKHDIVIEELKSIPLRDFNNVLNLQPGTVFTVITSDAKEEISNQLSIRGGTGIGIFVDGMNISESISSGSMTNFNLSALQATEILTGGFNAEYGNIRSGVINVVTREGGPKFHFSLDGKVSNVARKHFGASIYDLKTAPEWLLYGYDDALFGPDGVHEANSSDSYWEKWADADTTYGFTPEQAQEVWKYQHRPREYGHRPDYILDGSFGGPIYKDKLSYFSSLRFEYNMFSVPLSRDHFEDLNWFWKVSSRPFESVKLNIQGNYQQNLSTTTYNTSHVSVASAEQAVFSMQYPLTKYYDGMRSIADRYRNQYGLSLTHMLSPTMFYDFNLSYLLRRSFVNHANPRSSATAFRVGDFEFDSGPYGGWVPAPTTPDFGGREAELDITTPGFSFILGAHGKERDFSREELINARFDFVSQVNASNQLKTGLEVNYDKMHLNTGLVQYSPPMVKMNEFKRQPLRLAGYVQDKLEFKGMIANLGLRVDYTTRSGAYYTDMFSSFYEVDSVDFAPTSTIEPYLLVSPRLGISHPISDMSKLFFNYGHFYDEPDVEYLYIVRERENGDLDRIPNSNLRPQKTIAYELGFEQQFGSDYLLHFSGYYRDIKDQIKSIQYYSNLGTYVNTFNNDNYADVRGFEALFEKKLGTWMVGSLSYDYLVRSSGNVGNSAVYEDPAKTPIESRHEQYTYSDYTFVGNVTFKTPDHFGPGIFGFEPLSDWNLNFTHLLRSGKTVTWNPQNLPGVVNNMRWRDHQNTDMRLSRGLSLGRFDAQLYLEVYNLFNRKEMTQYLRSYLLPNLKLYNDYMNSLREGDKPGDYEQDYILLPDSKFFPTQLLFMNPRRFYVGIRINF